jgi:hypothetical protein
MHAGRSNWPKIVGLAPADMADSIIPTKKIRSKQPRLSAGTTPIYFELALLYVQGKSSVFVSTFSFYLRFL